MDQLFVIKSDQIDSRTEKRLIEKGETKAQSCQINHLKSHSELAAVQSKSSKFTFFKALFQTDDKPPI